MSDPVPQPAAPDDGERPALAPASLVVRPARVARLVRGQRRASCARSSTTCGAALDAASGGPGGPLPPVVPPQGSGDGDGRDPRARPRRRLAARARRAPVTPPPVAGRLCELPRVRTTTHAAAGSTTARVPSRRGRSPLARRDRAAATRTTRPRGGGRPAGHRGDGGVGRGPGRRSRSTSAPCWRRRGRRWHCGRRPPTRWPARSGTALPIVEDLHAAVDGRPVPVTTHGVGMERSRDRARPRDAAWRCATG